MLKQTNKLIKSKNIAIVGTGLVGRVLAINLLNDGHRLTLFDKDNKDGHTSAGFTAKFSSFEVLEWRNVIGFIAK